MLSYAQNFEDVYIKRCFRDKLSGFYVDIGASHPVHCNSTYYFYTLGWRGINVEPTKHRYMELQRARPKDTNIHAAIGRNNGYTCFHFSAHADHLSSLYPQDPHVISQHAAHVIQEEVQVITLATLLESYAPAEIDFIKIDVEGAESDVIAGNDWSRWRPKVIYLEATIPCTGEPSYEWETRLLQADYNFVFFDGVNRFYVAKEYDFLCKNFTLPSNPFDQAFAFHSYGNPLDDRRHPDYHWARNFAERIFSAAAIETDDLLFSIMTWDLHKTELEAPTTLKGITLAFRRVLNCEPNQEALNYWLSRQDLTLTQLYKDLLAGPEFILRRTRISVPSMWR